MRFARRQKISMWLSMQKQGSLSERVFLLCEELENSTMRHPRIAGTIEGILWVHSRSIQAKAYVHRTFTYVLTRDVIAGHT
jgi:hypothetical protein